jgi:hypothetical protein
VPVVRNGYTGAEGDNGPEKYENVGKSQSVLTTINPIISPPHACEDGTHERVVLQGVQHRVVRRGSGAADLLQQPQQLHAHRLAGGVQVHRQAAHGARLVHQRMGLARHHARADVDAVPVQPVTPELPTPHTPSGGGGPCSVARLNAKHKKRTLHRHLPANTVSR